MGLLFCYGSKDGLTEFLILLANDPISVFINLLRYEQIFIYQFELLRAACAVYFFIGALQKEAIK